jgi:urease accessory protein
VLTPRNHGDAAWAFLASLGGGLVDGDRLDVDVDVGAGAAGLLGTQASTKVYRSRASGEGCTQRLRARVAEGGMLAVVPDPVVCFADARYAQDVEVHLAPSASLCLVDGYTCGRSARGERWAFSGYASRTTVAVEGERALVDAVHLDPRHGALAERMGRFDVVLTLLAIGPRLAPVREAMLAAASSSSRGAAASDAVLVAASALPRPSHGGASLLRVAAERFEMASQVLRSSFAALAQTLGDDPFARKW